MIFFMASVGGHVGCNHVVDTYRMNYCISKRFIMLQQSFSKTPNSRVTNGLLVSQSYIDYYFFCNYFLFSWPYTHPFQV